MSNTAFHQYAINHDHNHQSPISDHYPLTKQEIAELLQHAQEAYRSNDDRTIFSIQHRLEQGIIGYQCPSLYEGPIAKADAKLNELFVSRRGQYTDFDLVDELYAIMQHQGM